MRRLFAQLLLGCLVAMTLVLPAVAAPRVLVVLSEETGPYAEAARTLRDELSEVPLAVGRWSALAETTAVPPELVITVGQTALEQALRGLAEKGWERVPLLATLLPRSAYDATLAKGLAERRLVSAILLDQPLSRQLALIRRALPGRERVAVLPGPLTRPQLPQLQREAASLGLRLFPTQPVNAIDQIYPALREAFEAADVLLALPDPLIYNANTLQNILLASYRARVPLVAFSAAYVKAGALLSVFATPQQVARAAAAAAKSHLAGRGLPPPHAPSEFTVVANPYVAASLGLRLDDEKQIADELRRAEGRP